MSCKTLKAVNSVKCETDVNSECCYLGQFNSYWKVNGYTMQFEWLVKTKNKNSKIVK